MNSDLGMSERTSAELRVLSEHERCADAGRFARAIVAALAELDGGVSMSEVERRDLMDCAIVDAELASPGVGLPVVDLLGILEMRLGGSRLQHGTHIRSFVGLLVKLPRDLGCYPGALGVLLSHVVFRGGPEPSGGILCMLSVLAGEASLLADDCRIDLDCYVESCGGTYGDPALGSAIASLLGEIDRRSHGGASFDAPALASAPALAAGHDDRELFSGDSLTEIAADAAREEDAFHAERDADLSRRSLAREVEACARAHGDQARAFDCGGNAGGAAELRRVENLLWALARGGRWLVVLESSQVDARADAEKTPGVDDLGDQIADLLSMLLDRARRAESRVAALELSSLAHAQTCEADVRRRAADGVSAAPSLTLTPSTTG